MDKNTFSPFPVLTTPRFVLRALSMDDKNEIFVLRTDDGVNEFLDRAKAGSMKDVEQFIERIQQGIAKQESLFWVIEWKDEPGLAGTICMWNISTEDAQAEIGYELLPRQQGKGIIQEVLPVVIAYGFETMGLRVIVGGMSVRNVKSARLLEKNGFVRDGGDGEEVYYKLEKYISR